MGDFRTFHHNRRAPASPLAPVIDPAGWTADELIDLTNWSYRLTGGDVDDLLRGIESVRRKGVDLTEIDQANFPLSCFGDLLADVRQELLGGRGIVMLRGFPVDLDRESIAIAFLGLGSYLGERMPQNKYGHVLGHVKDLGGDYADPVTRGYMTRAEMRFHADACDYVGLLCLQTPKSGGASRIASSVTVYNRMLERRPDLVDALCRDFYHSRSGEVNPGEGPWYKQPVFSFCDGYFSATGVGAAIEKAQALPGVPKFTEAQSEAVRLYRQIVEECALDIEFERGDVQFLNNFVMLHTRREYEDWPESSRKRHLLRLWIADPQGRPVPAEQRTGRSGCGVHIAGISFRAPLDAEAAA